MAQQNGDDQNEIVITEQDAPPLTPNERRILSAIFFAAHADSYVFNSEGEHEHDRQWDAHWKSLTKEAKEIYYPESAQDRFFAMEFYEAYDFGFHHTAQTESINYALNGMLRYVEDQRDCYWESLPDQERHDWIAKYAPDARNECP